MSVRPEGVKTIEVFVFYFDVARVVEKFLSDQSGTLHNLRSFQRLARREFPFAGEHSYAVTLYDNVWCRVNVSQPGLPSLLLNYAGSVMRAAQENGFPDFFGCITKGQHEYCPEDRMLVAADGFEDLKEQHIDITSEPHIRAALAEKWRHVVNGSFGERFSNSVWVSDEVLVGSTLEAEAGYADATFKPLPGGFDLRGLDRSKGQTWSFVQSNFRAIRPLDC